MAQATAQFVGQSVFSSPLGVIRFAMHWIPVERRLRKSPGYCGIRSWYSFPYTLGQIVFFTDRDAMRAFAGDPLHVACMRWLAESGVEKAGFIRFYSVTPSGYTSGEWHVVREMGTGSHVRECPHMQRGS